MKTSNTINRALARCSTSSIIAALAALLGIVSPSPAAPVSTAFTYQGKLSDGGQPANGLYDFVFVIYDSATNQLPLVSGVLVEDVAVSNGVFTAYVDFVPNPFTGGQRWLELAVRPGEETGNFTPLAERQPITATPYAAMALSVPNGSITANQIAAGSIGSAQLAPGAVTATNIAFGSVSGDALAPDAALNNLLNSGQSGVASGGVILSESPNAANLVSAGYSKLSEQAIELSPEKWESLGTAPLMPGAMASGRRRGHTVVWTGTEYIIWGGITYDAEVEVNTGLRFNPNNGTWTATSLAGAPTARTGHSAVWTGSDMIIWGGKGTQVEGTGARYNPSTDTWTTLTAANPPTPRTHHAAVWTGTEMIIWGGVNYAGAGLQTGARYHAGNNTWTPMTLTGAPAGRMAPSAVWTGSQLLIWGGCVEEGGAHSTVFSGGARYTPANNTWSPIPTNNSPAYRHGHSTVWTGTEMIVLGGYQANYVVLPSCIPVIGCAYWDSELFNGGGRYNPANNTWTALPAAPTNAPTFLHHTAVWTGNEMVTWGGFGRATEDDDDNPLSIPSLPYPFGGGTLPVSDDGGYYVPSNQGMRFRPSDNSWSFISTNNAPAPREVATATWTGSEMLIWGDDRNVGGRYKPSNNTWTLTTPSPTGDTTERTDFASVWTGSELVIWGGQSPEGALLRSGLRHNPTTKTWKIMNPVGSPSARKWASIVWTGTEVIVWGGQTAAGVTNTGARYNPVTDAWTALPTTNAPASRRHHAAVWAGNQMVIWGGSLGMAVTGTGARYNPASNTWTPTSTANAPSARAGASAVWTGAEVIVWGGGVLAPYESTGARYNPSTDLWTPTSLTGVPAGRTGHTAVWTGTEMIVWGGIGFGTNYADGGRYSPATGSWTAIPKNDDVAPARLSFTAVWAAGKLIVWGGFTGNSLPVNSGGVYDLATGLWTKTSLTGAPLRGGHAAVWTGTQMLVWGGGNSVETFIDAYSYSPRRQFYLYMKP